MNKCNQNGYMQSSFTRLLRRRMTSTEIILWKELRNRKHAHLKVRRQVAIGPFIVDFLIRSQRLIIEIDGPIHKFKKEYDEWRTEYLHAMNYRIIRFTNEDVEQRLEKVLSFIKKEAHKK